MNGMEMPGAAIPLATSRRPFIRYGRSRTVLVAIVLGMTLSSASGHVHHGADGITTDWYPRECCHDGDCRPVSRIRSSDQGLWMTTEDGITVLTSWQKTHRLSHDNRWHVCVSFDEFNQPVVLCIFEPGSSSAV